MDKNIYDVKRQMGVILSAIESFGIDASFNGRNDLISHGQKFSGSAFCLKKNAALHHGTLLINSDIKRLRKFLKPSNIKITDKGIKSIRSSVINLSMLTAKINVRTLSNAIIKSFNAEYGESAAEIDVFEIASKGEIDKLIDIRRSDEWLYEHCIPFDAELSNKFKFGNATLKMHVKKAVVQTAEFLCDGVKPEITDTISSYLIGAKFNAASLSDKINNIDNEFIKQIAAWIKEEAL
jgi:lipoate---protein ligase